MIIYYIFCMFASIPLLRSELCNLYLLHTFSYLWYIINQYIRNVIIKNFMTIVYYVSIKRMLFVE